MSSAREIKKLQRHLKETEEKTELITYVVKALFNGFINLIKKGYYAVRNKRSR